MYACLEKFYFYFHLVFKEDYALHFIIFFNNLDFDKKKAEENRNFM